MGECKTKSSDSTPVLSYSSKYKAIYVDGWTNYQSGMWIYYAGISGSKLVTKQHCHAWSYPEDKYVIGENAKQEKVVTSAKYNSFCKKYFQNGKVKAYQMMTNTAANREEFVK